MADVLQVAQPTRPVLLITGYAVQATLGADTLAADMHMVTNPFSLEAWAEKVKMIVG